ncbi:hypothetical protein HHL27_21125 [Novosphingobium sp. TW-4]|uniref:Polyvalent protein metallopeptidase domain-containing protein n=1 Tax=Novosphingobium olei TaxID=2728851 RepID=A0A7Y0BTA9_9SPHN|nr:hypothetical protein [Novosphingobium olei]
MGGAEAYYVPSLDYVQVPPQVAFHEPIDWYRTALHELAHFNGHSSRLNRDQQGTFGSVRYGREELVAEMACAFTCAALGIMPTVRHADYIGVWLTLLREDEKAIFLAMRFDNATIAGLAEAHGLTSEAILAEFAAAIRILVRTLEPRHWQWLTWWRR